MSRLDAPHRLPSVNHGPSRSFRTPFLYQLVSVAIVCFEGKFTSGLDQPADRWHQMQMTIRFLLLSASQVNRRRHRVIVRQMSGRLCVTGLTLRAH
jgi:hypothetical protein